VLKFESEYIRENFLQGFEQFIHKVGVERDRFNMTLHAALRQAVTRKDRQKRLEMFFRVVFSQVSLGIQMSKIKISWLHSIPIPGKKL
jgi:hypothetical protein